MNCEFSDKTFFFVVRYFLLFLPVSLVLINYENVKLLFSV